MFCFGFSSTNERDRSEGGGGQTEPPPLCIPCGSEIACDKICVQSDIFLVIFVLAVQKIITTLVILYPNLT